MLDIAQASEPTSLGSPRRPNADLPPRQGPPDHPPGSPGKNKGGYIRIIVIYNDIYISHYYDYSDNDYNAYSDSI